MIIRKAGLEDVSGILKLVMSFYEEGINKSGISFDKESIKKTIEFVINNHVCIVACNESIVGIIAGFVSPSIYDYNQKILEEKIWFIDKKLRGSSGAIRLFKEFEEYAIKNKINTIIMTHMVGIMPDNVRKIYKSFKYKHIENNYIKTIGG